MPAYIITEIEVTDPVRYEDYKKMSSASIQAFGGRFIVRGGAAETLEGDWVPKRVVVVEFPTLPIARAWWASQEYAAAKKLRQETSNTRMIAIDGV